MPGKMISELYNHKIKVLNFSAIVIATLSVVVAQTATANEDEFFDFDAPPQVVAKPLKNVESICEQYVTRKMNKKVGLNVKANGEEYFLNVGEATISSPPGSENYITSRQNSFAQAELAAKKNILLNIKALVSRKMSYELAQPKKMLEQPQAGSELEEETLRFKDNRDLTSAYNKALELLNRELDAQLDATAPPEPVKSIEEVEEKIQAVLGKKFSDQIGIVSFSQLYGVRRVFALDNSPAGEQGRMCVVLVYSDKTRAVADGMLLKDASYFPIGKPGAPLQWNQIPNPDTSEGVSELMNTFGVDMVRDENGNYVLVSYAQSGVAIENDQDAIDIAKNIARDRAISQLRTFMGESASLRNAGEFEEVARKFKDGSGEYNFNNDYSTLVKSESEQADVAGFEQGRTWGTKHPVTDQTIVGTWVSLSSATLAASAKNKAGFNNRPSQKPKASATTSSSSTTTTTTTTTRGMVGGAGRGTSEDDF